MEPSTRNKLVGIVILAVIGFGILIYTQKSRLDKFANQKDSFVTKPNLLPVPKEVIQVKPGQWPAILPSGIFLEPDAQILQLFYSVPSEKTKQATLQYITKKSLEENFQLYQKYLKDKGWEILSTVDQPYNKSLSAKKLSVFINIIMIVDQQNNQKVIGITATTQSLSY